MTRSWPRLFAFTAVAPLFVGLLIGWASGFVDMDTSRTRGAAVVLALVVLSVLSVRGFLIELRRVNER